MEKHIVLIGIRGSGKSTIGPLLAQKLGRSFIDIDVVLTDKAGVTSILEVNRLKGKEWAATTVHTLLAEVLHEEVPVVFASGGRTFSHEFPDIKSQNRTLLKQLGIAVLLSASDDVLWQRIATDTSTRHAGDDPVMLRKKFEESLSYKDVYKQLADVEIQTDAKTPEEITDEIIHAIQAYKNPA